ncbi:TatD family hydrolase [Candidatus Roizmanbacteria bacterium]|nr:TatD family hydrolase [Candidatus Roizmanbacteria bacterium]
MTDTHAHLNFKRFAKNVDEVISQAQQVGVTRIVVPGTDIKSSTKAVELSKQYKGVYAAIGIHPHHVFSITYNVSSIKQTIDPIERLVIHPRIVAVGEIGLDKHVYEDTKYENYHINDDFLMRQRELLIAQLQLAIQYNKSVILHNREATDELLELLNKNWNSHFEGRIVFHCCEPNKNLLEFAKKNNVFIGVDGDITYNKEKQTFIKEVPLNLLVLETDSPFLLPEPLRSQKKYPNEPKNIPIILSFIANLVGAGERELEKQTDENAGRLFNLV